MCHREDTRGVREKTKLSWRHKESLEVQLVRKEGNCGLQRELGCVASRLCLEGVVQSLSIN